MNVLKVIEELKRELGLNFLMIESDTRGYHYCRSTSEWFRVRFGKGRMKGEMFFDFPLDESELEEFLVKAEVEMRCAIKQYVQEWTEKEMI
jgi:hypothetical protein